MFETAELGQKVSSREYKERERLLWTQLLETQREVLRHGRFPVLIDFAGVHGAGKSATVNILNKWMNARWIYTYAYGASSDQESERPEFWRFWRDLPRRGEIGLYLSGRYSRPLLDLVYGKIDDAEFERCLDRIAAFERTLADDGALILKFWMHLGKKAQKRRLKALETHPLEKWRVAPEDWENWNRYDSFITAAERLIARTDFAHAPWHIVEGQDHAYRSLHVGEIVRDSMARRLEESRIAIEVYAKSSAEPVGNSETAESDTVRPQDNNHAGVTVLDSLDLTKKLSKSTYERALRERTAELSLLHRKAMQQGKSTILVFEGPDAAGKGGIIRRLTAGLDAPNYRIVAFAAPTREEDAHHYLWRFWKELPRAGRLRIFDRSWYGRVLVERVEGFASPEEWGRAYNEINEFEAQLVEHGSILLKFWIHVSKEEQLARFKARETTPHKRWKLGEEDWRNRNNWDAYQLAVHDMIQRTSTTDAPWQLIPGNCKLYSRTRVMKLVSARMAAALES